MKLTRTFVAFTSAMFMSSAVMAYTFESAPAGGVVHQQQGEVQFITGGIGDEETAALEGARDSYNVHIMNSRSDGAFAGDIATSIYDRKGNQVLAVDAGPLLYTSLPKGKYTVVAEYEGVQQKKPLSVTSSTKSKDIHLTWSN